jgi:enterochelin esterase family protein
MAAALKEKGYDHKFVFGEGVHSGNHGTQLFPDAMRWIWRDEVPGAGKTEAK